MNVEEQVSQTIPFLLNEVEVYKKKVRKAPGWNIIDTEHIKYGGYSLCHLLIVIINSENRIESVPLHIKRGIIVPVDKPGKDLTYKDNNRCIML